MQFSFNHLDSLIIWVFLKRYPICCLTSLILLRIFEWQCRNAFFNAKHNNYNFAMFIKSIVHDCNYIFWHFNVFPIWNTSLPSRRTPFQLTFESLCKIFSRRRQYQICWILIKANHHLLWCPSSSKRISILVYWFFLFFLDLSP